MSSAAHTLALPPEPALVVKEHKHRENPEKWGSEQKPERLTADGVTDKFKMWFVVNQDLKKMKHGKLAAQCAHGAVIWTHKILTSGKPDPVFDEWFANGQPKVVVKAPEATLLVLLKAYPLITVAVKDAGRTQIAANSLTVVALRPIEVVQCPSEISDLPLA